MSVRGDILKSLVSAWADTPELAALLPGGLHSGRRVALDEVHPFGTLTISERGHEGNTAGVKLVDYEVMLTVYVDEVAEVAGDILGTFHDWFDRLAELTALDSDVAELVLIFPVPSPQVEEETDDAYGKDVIRATTGWTLKIAEKQIALA